MRAVVDCSVRVAVPVVDRGAGVALPSINAGWPASGRPRRGTRDVGQHHDGLLSSLMAVVRPTSTPWRVADRALNASRSPRLRELDLVVPAGRGPAGANRFEPIVRRAAGASEGADFDDVLTGRGHLGNSGGEASRSLQTPRPGVNGGES
jgi:hypothetical protein